MSRSRATGLCLGLTLALGLASTAANMAASAAGGANGWAVLQGLDKVTARVTTFTLAIDEVARFGSLEIVAKACHKPKPEEPADAIAFLQIEDIGVGKPRSTVFSGWMFASSPAVSALEHPVYDVWVLDCRDSAPES